MILDFFFIFFMFMCTKVLNFYLTSFFTFIKFYHCKNSALYIKLILVSFRRSIAIFFFYICNIYVFLTVLLAFLVDLHLVSSI